MIVTKLWNSEKKLFKYLEELKKGKVLVYFSNGIGDSILFQNILVALRNIFTEIEFKMCHHPYMELDWIDPNNIFTLKGNNNINLNPHSANTMEKFYNEEILKDLESQYDIVVEIDYHEPPLEYMNTKTDFCNQIEVGIPCSTVNLENFKLNIPLKNTDSNIVGVHYISNSCLDRKTLNEKDIEKIWNEIIEYGLQPLEIHSNKGAAVSLQANIPKWMGYKNSIRFSANCINDIVDSISKCKYFVGIESGPLVIAYNILGYNKVIGMERSRFLQRYLPERQGFYKINMDYENGTYKSGIIKEIFDIIK